MRQTWYVPLTPSKWGSIKNRPAREGQENVILEGVIIRDNFAGKSEKFCGKTK